MSGGSLNYLYCKEPAELFERIYDMEIVEDVLLREGYCDIARDVRRLIEYVKTAENRITVLHNNLKDVFHAVEWYISADYGKGTMLKAFEEYRNGGERHEN